MNILKVDVLNSGKLQWQGCSAPLTPCAHRYMHKDELDQELLLKGDWRQSYSRCHLVPARSQEHSTACKAWIPDTLLWWPLYLNFLERLALGVAPGRRRDAGCRVRGRVPSQSTHAGAACSLSSTRSWTRQLHLPPETSKTSHDCPTSGECSSWNSQEPQPMGTRRCLREGAALVSRAMHGIQDRLKKRCHGRPLRAIPEVGI